MKYTIQIMENKLLVDDKYLTGYAFLDQDGHCMIIVYGENKRNLLKNYYDS